MNVGVEKSQEDPATETAGLLVQLLHLAGDLREHVIGVAADQLDRTDHDHQDYRQHHRVLGDILTAFLSPKLTDSIDHVSPPATTRPALTISPDSSSPSCD
jgi:hypothetical protein